MSVNVQDILSISKPVQTELLVVVFDLTNFTQFSRSQMSGDIFRKMSEFSAITSEFVQAQGGLIIKFIGDAGLCIFPSERSSDAIGAMVELKTRMDHWLFKKMPGSRLAVNIHFGEVTVGPMPGFGGTSQIDIIGDTVNICFTMGKKGFNLSPQAFRTLKKEGRTRFRKFTPPITYQLVTSTT